MIKIGDHVAYLYLPENEVTNLKCGVGTAYHIDDKSIYLGFLGQMPVNVVGPDWIYEIASSETKDRFIKIIDDRILAVSKNIRKLTAEEKDELLVNEFNKLKGQISTTAAHMIEAKDDSDFINKLKAICMLKQQLFSIKVNDIDNVHKSNGNYKYKIKQLTELRNKVVDFNFNII